MILETVGVGQAEHSVRDLVDTLILVLHPDAGDSIQAMKSGLMEVSDIYVVNKADLPGATRMVKELRAVLKALPANDGGWTPPVIEATQARESTIGLLDEAIEMHRTHALDRRDDEAVRRARHLYHLKSLLRRHLDELLFREPHLHVGGDITSGFANVIARIGAACGDNG